jgi:hypothetical protein
MTRQLVFVHGRAQEKKDAAALKGEWIQALNDGLAKSGLTLPIGEQDVRFPFYGDALFDMVGGLPAEQAAEIIVKGDDADDEQRRFTRAIVEEIRQKLGITEDQIAQVSNQSVVQKGPENWEWVQAVLRAADRFVPHASAASIAMFTNDVFLYLRNSIIRETIDDGVMQALGQSSDSVVVSHSLGTVVAYNLLRQQGHDRGWTVPLFVTLGSPLAIAEVRKTLRGLAPIRCPQTVSAWYNAMDERDVVALYPLTATRFPLNPVQPAIENKTDVRNETPNRHGISGYLTDRDVAKRIYDALTA